VADTFGDLIDKLTIANVRLWNLEDQRREYCNSSDHKDDVELKNFLNKISATNKERNSLIDQINSSMNVLLDRAANNNSSFVLTCDELLGTGKNKFYKREDRK